MNERLRSLLVSNAKFASLPSEKPEALAAKRLRRFYLQAAARELLPEYRVSKCLRSVVPGKDCVKVHYSEKHQRAHFGNLVQCASVWVDPVCSSKITERRRLELTDGLSRSVWPGLMVTLTFQHNRYDHLADLREDFCAGRRKLRSGRWWPEFSKRWGIVGTITATEVTYGLDAGFHLHTHELYLVESVPDTKELQEELSIKFGAIMRKAGRYVAPEIGVHVRATTPKAADYISKWGVGFEMTKAPNKQGDGGHYTPFELLYLYAGEGEAWAGEVFKEYAAAMVGVNQIRWSPPRRWDKENLCWKPGLHELLSLGEEITDTELVEAPEESDRILASLSLKQWGVIQDCDKRGELLEVASTGKAELLRAWLLAIGVMLES